MVECIFVQRLLNEVTSCWPWVLAWCCCSRAGARGIFLSTVTVQQSNPILTKLSTKLNQASDIKPWSPSHQPLNISTRWSLCGTNNYQNTVLEIQLSKLDDLIPQSTNHCDISCDILRSHLSHVSLKHIITVIKNWMCTQNIVNPLTTKNLM